jgi:hypothetical protein
MPTPPATGQGRLQQILGQRVIASEHVRHLEQSRRPHPYKLVELHRLGHDPVPSTSSRERTRWNRNPVVREFGQDRPTLIAELKFGNEDPTPRLDQRPPQQHQRHPGPGISQSRQIRAKRSERVHIGYRVP